MDNRGLHECIGQCIFHKTTAQSTENVQLNNANSNRNGTSSQITLIASKGSSKTQFFVCSAAHKTISQKYVPLFKFINLAFQNPSSVSSHQINVT